MIGLENMTNIYLWGALFLLLAACCIMIFMKSSRIRKEYRKILSRRYGPGEIICHDNYAHYLGVEQFAGIKASGKGVLVLAQRELFFLQVLPELEICIPVKRIKRCIQTSNFRGKPMTKPVLKIDYKDENGSLNSAAWYVRDIDSFENSIKAQRKRNRPRKKK